MSATSPRLFCGIALVLIAALCRADQLDRVPGPSFDVTVNLSAAAAAAVSRGGNKVRVFAVFDGDDKSGPSDRNAPERSVYLGVRLIEIAPGQIAKFRNILLQKSEVEKLAAGRYFVTVNAGLGKPEPGIACDVIELTDDQMRRKGAVTINCN